MTEDTNLIDPTVQEIRCSVDQILQIVNICIGIPIIETYKSKINPLLYLPMIRSLLEDVNPNYDASPLVDDTTLFEHLDVSNWLTLMLERWDLFETILIDSSRGDVEHLKQLRNKLAHYDDIPQREVHKGAEIAARLFQSFGYPEQAKAVNDIRVQLDLQLERIKAGYIPSPKDWRMNTESSANGNEEVEAIDEEATLPFTTLKDYESPLEMEIVHHDGTVKDGKIPLVEDRVVIGRSKLHAKIKVDDPRVSRVHLLIAKASPNELKVTDLMSANGSTLDGVKLEANISTSWKVGQTIIVGNTWLILRQGVA